MRLGVSLSMYILSTHCADCRVLEKADKGDNTGFNSAGCHNKTDRHSSDAMR